MHISPGAILRCASASEYWGRAVLAWTLLLTLTLGMVHAQPSQGLSFAQQSISGEPSFMLYKKIIALLLYN